MSAWALILKKKKKPGGEAKWTDIVPQLHGKAKLNWLVS